MKTEHVELPDTFISVYMPIAGWKAVMLKVDEDCGGQHTPWATADYAFATKAEAIADARRWAESEGLQFIDTCVSKTDDAPSESVTEQLRTIFGDTAKIIEL